MTKQISRLLLILALLVVNIGCDRITKEIAQAHLKGQPVVRVVGDVFILTYSENTGALLGLGGDLPAWARLVFLALIPAIVLVWLLGYVLRRREMPVLLLTGWCCVIAGGFSNVFDRLFNDGRVVDFMNFGIGSLRTGILNCADLSLVGGIIVVLIAMRNHGKKDGAPDGTTPGE